jgi:hypothetical protein
MVGGDFTDVDGPVYFGDTRNDNDSDTSKDAGADDGSYSKGAPATKNKRKKGAMTKTRGKRAAKAAKRNKKRQQKKNPTINSDSVLLSGKDDVDGGEGVAYGYSRGDDSDNLDNDSFEEKRYEKMKKGMYDAICWQHVWRSLCFAEWSDNALV